MGTEREVPPPGSSAVGRHAGPPAGGFAEVRRVERTGSTNADLLALARAGQARTGLVLVTDHQTAGRGRQGRVWQDRPSGSLLVSVLLRAEPAWASLIPLATGLAAVGAVADAGGVTARLKWPNDVLVPAAGERKLAGILAEATAVDGALWVVVGMGLNLRWPDELPAELADRLVSLADLGAPVPRDDLLDAWLARLGPGLAALATPDGRREVLDSYRRVCLSIGRAVRMSTPTGDVEGVVEGVADDGGLLLRVGGELRRLDAGDVHHLGPGG